MTSSSQSTPHKLFISYYHAEDEDYRNEFERQFSSYYITKRVNLGDLDSTLSADYVKQQIRTNFVADASVVVVLVGPNTWRRKHVDWEISGSLEPYNGRSGLLGVLLPRFPFVGSNFAYNPELLPPRLNDNVNSGYASLCYWSSINGQPAELVRLVNTAFSTRLRDDLVQNNRLQYSQNR